MFHFCMLPSSKKIICYLALLTVVFSATMQAQQQLIRFDQPDHDRWFYPHNTTPGTRPQASVFSALPMSGGLDDRWGFFLLGFDTFDLLPLNLPPDCYRIRSVKLTATVGTHENFRYDPTYDSWRTYATTTRDAEVADADIGRPVELSGVGFRQGFTARTFTEISPHGSSNPGMRHAFPLGYTTVGEARDVSSNVTMQFESVPWAIGQAPIAAGSLVPEETRFSFDLNLNLPGVTRYLQQSLSLGRLWFSLHSMHPAFEQGGEFASFYTKDDIGHELFGGLAPTLELEVEIVHPLNLQINGQQVTLQWPSYAGNRYVLQASPNLSPGSWQNLHQQDVVQDGSSQFSVPFSPGSRFFRLSLQPSAL